MGSLRRYRDIPRFQLTTQVVEGELVNVRKAAEILELAPSTLLRWLEDGFIAGEQITPKAPWQIRMPIVYHSRRLSKVTCRGFGFPRDGVLMELRRGNRSVS